MKKNLMVLRALALSLMITLMGGSALAKEYYEDCSTEMECCGDTPFECGGWNVKGKVGIAPSIFTGRGTVWGVSCENSVDAGGNYIGSPIFAFSNMPKFNDLFKNPGFTVGAEIGYAMSDYAESFLEVNWRRYSGNKHDNNNNSNEALITLTGVPAAMITLGIDNLVAGGTTSTSDHRYSAIGGYAGMRRHFGRYWCNRFSVFVGAKVGILHRNRIDTNLVLVQTAGDPIGQTLPTPRVSPLTVAVPSVDKVTTLFAHQNTISGGPQVGFNFCFWKAFSFQVTGEFVASGAFKSNRNFVLPPTNFTDPVNTLANQTAFTNVIFGETGVEMTFPVTFGLTYEF